MLKSLILMALAASSTTFAWAGHDLSNPSTDAPVVNATVSTARPAGPLVVTVLGELKNTTGSKIDNLVIEARLSDASGKLVDVLTESLYELVVPAGEQVAFRLQGPAAAAPDAYASVQVRVVSGESQPPPAERSSRNNANRWVELAMSWGPMIFLIAVWIWLARKYSGKGSYQEKMLEAVVEQNAWLARQGAAIEKIASTLEPRPPDNGNGK